MTSSKLVRLVITLVTGASVLCAADQAQGPFPKPNWQVKYLSGSLGLKRGTWLRVAFGAEQRSQTGIDLVTVSQEHITAVRFSAKAEQESELLEGMQRSGCAYARSMMPKPTAQRWPQTLFIALASPGPISRFTERLNRRHYVRLVWDDRGTEQSAVLGVNDCEYASFLANLRELLGARWRAHEEKSD